MPVRKILTKITGKNTADSKMILSIDVNTPIIKAINTKGVVVEINHWDIVQRFKATF